MELRLKESLRFFLRFLFGDFIVFCKQTVQLLLLDAIRNESGQSVKNSVLQFVLPMSQRHRDTTQLRQCSTHTLLWSDGLNCFTVVSHCTRYHHWVHRQYVDFTCIVTQITLELSLKASCEHINACLSTRVDCACRAGSQTTHRRHVNHAAAAVCFFRMVEQKRQDLASDTHHSNEIDIHFVDVSFFRNILEQPYIIQASTIYQQAHVKVLH